MDGRSSEISTRSPAPTRTRRRARAVGIAALTAALLAAGATAAPALTPPPVPERIAGADRYETAALISQHAFPDGADIAYLVTGEGFADGLSAGPAAALEGGPVLLSRWGQLPPATLAELDRLEPATIVLVGGERSLDMGLDFELRGRYPGATVERVAGADRFETSRMLAERVFPAGSSAPSAFVATGLRFPDALAAGPAAAVRSGPMLLVDGGADRLDPYTAGTLDWLDAAWVGVAGGEEAVSSGILQGIAGDRAVRRFFGTDRFGTAAILLEAFPEVDTVYLASGEGYADAIAGAAAAGAEGAAMLLARRDCVPHDTLVALEFRQPDRVILLGGEPTLSATAAAYAPCD